MPQRPPPKSLKTFRQDLSMIVGLLLLTTMVLAAVTGLAGDEEEFFGLGDDLHAVMGWGAAVLTGLHTLLCWRQMATYAKRRFRNRLGVGGVIDPGAGERD